MLSGVFSNSLSGFQLFNFIRPNVYIITRAITIVKVPEFKYWCDHIVHIPKTKSFVFYPYHIYPDKLVKFALDIKEKYSLQVYPKAESEYGNGTFKIIIKNRIDSWDLVEKNIDLVINQMKNGKIYSTIYGH